MHTTQSDGELPPLRVAEAVEPAGVRAVLFSDHESATRAAGWNKNVLMIPGQESTLPSCHLLGLGLAQSLSAPPEPERAATMIRAAGGFDALAHPLDPPIERIRQSGCYAAIDYAYCGFSGLEVWNAMSAFKRGLSTVPGALARVFAPLAHLAGPHPLELALWDQVGRCRRWPGFAGADAHSFSTKRAWLPFKVFSYRRHADLITTGLWLKEPLAGEALGDTALVLDALREGRAVLALGRLRGAAALLLGAGEEKLPGEELAFGPGLSLAVRLPGRGRARLLCNGHPVARGVGREFRWPLDRPGVWRVEARQWRPPAGWRPWLFFNPFYLRENGFAGAA